MSFPMRTILDTHAYAAVRFHVVIDQTCLLAHMVFPQAAWSLMPLISEIPSVQLPCGWKGATATTPELLDGLNEDALSVH